MERMIRKQTVNLKSLGEDRATEVSFGRFLRNTGVTVKEILLHAAERLKEPAQGLHILAIQDTTEINYQKHAQKTTGLGTVGNGTDKGFFVHPVIAVDAQSGSLLGLCGAQIWQRSQGKAPRYYQLPIEQKESYRWLMGDWIARKGLYKTASLVTVVSDREGDIYEQWARRKNHLLVRVCQERKVVHEEAKRLSEFCEKLPVQGQYRLKLRARPPLRSAREATVEVGFGSVEIQRPAKCPDKRLPESLSLQVVEVREINAPPGEERIHWRLMTSHEVPDMKRALEVVGWYCQRWHIEQVFRTMKSQGLNVESSQVESADCLEKLVTIALIAAIQTMQLVNGRDGKLVRPGTDVFSEEEVAFQEVLQPRLEGKTQAQKNPFPPKTLAWSAWIIARLGGWKGYKSERPPGPITMGRGLQEFYTLFRGWSLGSAAQMLVNSV